MDHQLLFRWNTDADDEVRFRLSSHSTSSHLLLRLLTGRIRKDLSGKSVFKMATLLPINPCSRFSTQRFFERTSKLLPILTYITSSLMESLESTPITSLQGAKGIKDLSDMAHPKEKNNNHIENVRPVNLILYQNIYLGFS